MSARAHLFKSIPVSSGKCRRQPCRVPGGGDVSQTVHLDPPICDYCGGFIRDREQQCPARDDAASRCGIQFANQILTSSRNRPAVPEELKAEPGIQSRVKMAETAEHSNRVDPDGRLGNISRVLWYIGSHGTTFVPILTAVSLLMGSSDRLSGSSCLTTTDVLLGTLVRVGTVIYVRYRRQSVNEEFLQLVEQRRHQRAQQLGDQENIYAVAGPSGLPDHTRGGSRKWSAHYFIPGDDGVRIIGGPMVNFKTRSTSRVSTDERFSWNDIAGIDRLRPYL